MKSTRSARAALSDALFAARHDTQLLYHQLASRLSMSRRTLGRYVNAQAFPDPARAHAMLWELRDVSVETYAQLGDALGIEPEKRPPHRAAAPLVPQPPPRPPIDRAAEEAGVRLMLYTAAEATHVDPQAARTIALATLEHLSARGLDFATAHDLLRTVARVKK